MASSTATRGDTWRTVPAADMDGDRDVDLVVTRPSRLLPQVGLLVNDGRGHFTEEVLAFPASDGDTIGLCYSAARGAHLQRRQRELRRAQRDLRERADRRFSTGRLRFPAVSDNQDFTATMAAGDIDGDDDVDLYVGEAQAQQRIFRNDGRGGFSDVTNGVIGRLAYYPGERSLIFDVDDDGDLEIVSTVVTVRPGPAAYVMMNDGCGRFAPVAVPTAAASGSTAIDIAVGDVNRDNRFDLLWANASGRTDPMLELAEQDGSGGWRLSPIEVDVRAELLAIELADLDGDGDLDLVASSTAARYLLLAE